MKILIINASPRQKGLLSQMLDKMREEAESRGAEIVYIRTSKLSVRPCIGCMKCRTDLDCCLPKDDAQKMVEEMKTCDAVIIGSPCYWGNINGELKVMFDRMVYGMMGESERGIPKPLHKGKKAIIVSTCTTPFPFNIFFNQSRGVVKALKEILKWSGFKIVKTVERGGTKINPHLSEKDINACKKAVRRITA